MASLATFNFKLSQLYPGAGKYHLNTCANPDCSNFGQPLSDSGVRRKAWEEARPELTEEQLDIVAKHGPGAYKLSGADKKHRRVSCAFLALCRHEGRRQAGPVVESSCRRGRRPTNRPARRPHPGDASRADSRDTGCFDRLVFRRGEDGGPDLILREPIIL